MLFEYFVIGFYLLIGLPYIVKLDILMNLNFNWLLMVVVGLALHYLIFYILLRPKRFGKILMTGFFACTYGIYLPSLFLFNYKMDRTILASALENEIEMIFYFITFKSVILSLLVVALFYFLLTKIKFEWKINKFCLPAAGLIVVILVIFSVITKNRVYISSYPIIDFFDLLKINEYFEGINKGQKIKYEKKNDYFKYNGDDNINIVLVLGESVRNDYFNQHTKRINDFDIIRFTRSHSDYFYTRDSVPEMLTLKSGDKNFSIVDIMNASGFNTYWIGSQSISGLTESPYAYFAVNSKNRIYKESNRNIKMDFELLDYVDKYIKNSGKNFYIIHMIGSHTPFFYRFDKEHVIEDDYCKTKNMAECSFNQISNAYINSINYSDDFLSQLMAKFKDKKTIFFFSSDHGKNEIYINENEDIKTVPAFIWFNNINYNRNIVENNVKKDFHHKKIVSTILDCSGFESEYINLDDSICR